MMEWPAVIPTVAAQYVAKVMVTAALKVETARQAVMMSSAVKPFAQSTLSVAIHLGMAYVQAKQKNSAQFASPFVAQVMETAA